MNFREELRQAILTEFPQAANSEVELEKYLDEATIAHEAHPAIEISTFVVDFASPRGYYDELSPTLDYSKPMSEAYLKTPVQPMSDEAYAKRVFSGVDLNTFIVPETIEDDFIIPESMLGKEVINPYNGKPEILTLKAENGDTVDVVMDNTPTHRPHAEPRANGHYPGIMMNHVDDNINAKFLSPIAAEIAVDDMMRGRPTRTLFVDHESEERMVNLLGDTKPNKALLAEIMKCGDPEVPLGKHDEGVRTLTDILEAAAVKFANTPKFDENGEHIHQAIPVKPSKGKA